MENVHVMHLDEEPFAKIADGSKTIELRLYDDKRRQIKVGDEIQFQSKLGEIRAQVVALHIFANFDELYKTLDLCKCGYSKDVASASPEDMSRYYSADSQKRFGVVGIEIKRL